MENRAGSIEDLTVHRFHKEGYSRNVLNVSRGDCEDTFLVVKNYKDERWLRTPNGVHFI